MKTIGTILLFSASALVYAETGSTSSTASNPNPSSSPTSSSSATTSTGSAGTYSSSSTDNAGPIRLSSADRSYLKRMVQHHQQMIKLADRAVQQNHSDQVRGWAQQIADKQRQELTQLQQWLGEGSASASSSSLSSSSQTGTHDLQGAPPRVENSNTASGTTASGTTASGTTDATSSGSAAANSAGGIPSGQLSKADKALLGEIMQNQVSGIQASLTALEKGSDSRVLQFAQDTIRNEAGSLYDFRNYQLTFEASQASEAASSGSHSNGRSSR